MMKTDADLQKRAEALYNYRLYSVSQFRAFSKYAWNTAKEISGHYGGTHLGIWSHMLWCNLRYGVSHCQDYVLFEFYKKKGCEINTFLTRRRYLKLIKQFDKQTFFSLIDKAAIYNRYAEFIKRDWMTVDENTSSDEIKRFLEKHKRALLKPLSSEKGFGIKSISSNDIDLMNHLVKERGKHSYLLEEICENCNELKEINPSSLNTLRIYTIVNERNDVEIASVCVRCGCGNSVVDNWGSGGVCYPVDVETGVVCSQGVDMKGRKHIVHPGTSIVMPGMRIPRIKEACELAKTIIQKDKKVVYSGLDLAILPDRIELIEINFPGGRFALQILDQVGKYHLFNHIFKTK